MLLIVMDRIGLRQFRI